MSWSEIPALVAAPRPATVRIVERGGRFILNVTLRRAIAEAGGLGAATRFRALLGHNEASGRLRLEVRPEGPHRGRVYRGGSLSIALPLPRGWREEASRGQGATAVLVRGETATVEVSVPPEFLGAGARSEAAPPPAPLAKRGAADAISTPRRAGDPEIGRPGAGEETREGAGPKEESRAKGAPREEAGKPAVGLPPKGWRPRRGAAG